jgi:hypothetical protein
VKLEIRDADAAGRWMAAGMCLIRVGAPAAQDVHAVTRQMLVAVSESGALPPVGVLGDIGKLASGASLDFSSPLPATQPDVAKAVRAYEDQFLGRLAQDPKIEAIADAIARLPKSMRDDAVALLVSRILHRIAFEGAVSMSPGVARRVTEAPVEELLELGYAALRESSDVQALLAEGYQSLVARARRTGALLAEADVFVLENLTVLSSLTQRLAIEQIVEVSEELIQKLPRRMKPKFSKRAGRTPTNIEDEDRYPIGGFSSIATFGSLENLVTSELIYMDEKSDDVDLFDMRYVEGELLYYTRDESVFIRSRRVVTFVFEPELVRARFKDQDMRWQRLVAAMGLMSAMVKQLSLWLSEEALFFRVAFVLGDRDDPLEPERGLCRLLLGEWIEKEMAEVIEVDSIDVLLSRAEADARSAQADLILFTMTPRPFEDLDSRVRATCLDLSEPTAWSGWIANTLELLQSIIDGR